MTNERKHRTTSIRWSLSRNFVAVIVLLGLAIMATTVYTANRIRVDASRTLIDRAIGQAESDLRDFLAPVRRTLLLSRRWAANGLIDPSDSVALNRMFMPVLEQAPQISSLNLGDAQGGGFLLMRMGDSWRNRRVRTDESAKIEFAELDASGETLREWVVPDPAVEELYDPRTRAWYRVAVDGAQKLEADLEFPSGIYWTEPYSFFTTQEPGITASTFARTPDGEVFVIAFDVLLSDLSEFTRTMEISPHGFAIILDEARRVIGLPNHPLFDDPNERSRALLGPASELAVPAVVDAARAFRMRRTDGASTFAFESDDETYWANLKSVQLGINRRFEIAVAVPERDLLGVVQQQRVFIVAVTGLALLAATLMALMLSRRVSQPLGQLVANSRRMGRLELGEGKRISSNFEEVEHLAEEQERMRIALDAFSKYVPVELVRELLDRGEAAKIGGTQRVLTILFSDIVGFTTIAEAMTPQKLTSHMSTYFAELLEIIQADGCGDVNEIVGDGIVAFWGAPADDPDHSIHAVDAVLRCLHRLDELNPQFKSRGLPELPTCFGLATGPVVVGNVGAPSRMSYAAVGDTVNVASRVEGLNRIYGTMILATAAVRDEAGQGFRWRWVDRVRVKGKRTPVDLHELLGRAGEVSSQRLVFAGRYEEAFSLFRERHFDEALGVLEGLAEEGSTDLSVARLLDRARRLRADPPGDDWDAVSVFEVK
jgi:adenylate cyclase